MRTIFVKTALLPFLVLLGFSVGSLAQGADSIAATGIFDLLANEDAVPVTVKTNLSYLIENKKTSDEYRKGEFSFEPSKGVTMSLPVKIKCRGRFRRMKCDFPPLKLKFKKDDLAAHGLNEFNELKLVTHCMDDKRASKDLILREYLAYRLYNILTPNSFRAQMVQATYLNTKRKPKKIKGWGMLIEDSDELAYRMGGEKFEQMGIPADQFDQSAEKIAALFNFMIGNGDWDCLMARNVQFIKSPDSSIVVVPYDFDFSGLVNASYALPNRSAGEETVKDRVYLGQKCSVDSMQATFQYFIDKKELIMKEVGDMIMLSEASKTEIKEYLEKFYEIIGDEELAQEALFPKADKK
ncbi:MAG TPA: hypothetical protein ENJ95_09895 [Bacteroidetes bacterium]|nr:hypothetical protein [Bacteroidota bacterium]